MYRTGDASGVDKVAHVQHGILRPMVALARDHRILC
ncbi:hypothetical protein X548_10250 [Stenotrophomonas maltophilia 5BA-I-2]|nr:hypothetical protein X548_10250 [Stenotrophomonas maltophilia 5BA-I-2]